MKTLLVWLLTVFLLLSAYSATRPENEIVWRFGYCVATQWTLTFGFVGSTRFEAQTRTFGPDYFRTTVWFVQWPGGVAGAVRVVADEPVCLSQETQHGTKSA